ncbi:ABC transporter permease [Pseudonocardia alni]|jgi:rhamnose transport system permease protein|uniref:Autoinducer 2 import system permease protein LsrC n=1 Tax=Pseudonocardia alni TaxID=33907 RepID=A0A852W5Q5_PSEA5|nr:MULTISPECIES: ABC transporter permease [Pseudonocardia]MCO7192455.1 ABC transporter permease [Pseudonocardia sp. McavD-2-B]MYW73440.1 ABC transporter permease [Pseudonocardia sp. SID8383]NYG00822.1 ribose/xylose/arabinose/galactoside ABC-type transport system permease subunit [Pseudonocardia antarctica]OJG08507.1 Autoinducer 2 import system permease protein LsrC [Pseudonocardia autotrophica]
MSTSDTRTAPEAGPTPGVRRRIPREAGLGVVLVVLVVSFATFTPRFATGDTFAQIGTDLAIVLIVAVGQALVLFTRNIDVSVGSTVGLTAYLAAGLTAAVPGLPVALSVLAACLLGAALGAVNGALVATLKVPSIMVTLGTLYIFRGLNSAWAGSSQITAQNLPASYSAIATGTVLGIPLMVLYALAVAALAHLVVRHTVTGRAMLAVGSAPASAERTGIASKRLVFGAYTATGLLCGLAGVLWGARYGTVDSSVATGFELVVLAAVVVGGVSITGGVGTVGGVVLGAAILSVIGTGLALADVSAFWLQAVQGLVIILAITLDLVLRRRLESRGVST